MVAQGSQSREELWRLFVAIFPPPETVERLAAFIQEWKAQTGSAVRWIRPEKFHLTLCFIGDVPAGDVPQHIQSLASITVPDPAGIAEGSPGLSEATPGETAPPLLMDPNGVPELKGLGAFPNAKCPRVLWAGFQGGL